MSIGPGSRRPRPTSSVSPAPSLQEVLAADGARLGRVDFGLDADAAPLGPDAPVASGPVEPPEEPGHGPDHTAEPTDPEPTDPEPTDPEPTGPREPERAEAPDRPDDVPPQETGPSMSPSTPTPRRLRAVDPIASAEATDPERAEATPPATAHSADYLATVGSLGPPESQLRQLGLSVEHVAASVIARMREAGEANRRHLEALEAEAARRCELLTAQAELDAELIRLHARREAHAIIAAARTRVGDVSPPAERAQQRIEEDTETFAHFTELFGAPLEHWDDLEGLSGELPEDPETR